MKVLTSDSELSLSDTLHCALPFDFQDNLVSPCCHYHYFTQRECRKGKEKLFVQDSKGKREQELQVRIFDLRLQVNLETQTPKADPQTPTNFTLKPGRHVVFNCLPSS